MGFKIESLTDEGKYASIVDGHFLHKLNKVNDKILRDYFASQAMIGLTSSGLFNVLYIETYEKIPEYAYMMADEMMKAREKKGEL